MTGSKSRTRNIALVSLTVALTTIGAYFRIPLGPVPISLQTLFVLLAGSVLGAGTGAVAMVSYMVLGLVGLPVFTGGGGPQYILFPTFGFLLAFPVAAATVGLIMGSPHETRRPGPARRMAAMAAGTLVIYLVGVPWLGLNLLLVQNKPVGAGALLMMGMVPFLPGDVLKALLAFLLTEPVTRAVRRKGR